MTATKLILQKILNHALEQQKQGLFLTVVFDLDSTLFCVRHRNTQILNELAHDPELNQNFPQFTPALRHLQVTSQDWGIRTVLARSEVLGTIDFFEMIRKKWAEAFFSNSHLLHDEPYPGAVDYVNALASSGAQIRYLTGRDWPRMGDGTLASLKKWGFPLQTHQHLHMKPDTTRHDADFKLDVLQTIHNHITPLYFFENEPVIINLVHRSLPLLPIIFIDSIHSGRETIAAGVPIIEPDFRYESP